MKIDIASHIVLPKLLKALDSLPGRRSNQYKFMPGLTDLAARLKIMEGYPDVVQVLSIANCMEDAGSPDVVYELARIGNDEMAELVAKQPDKFGAALAAIPLNDVDRALKEIEHAIDDLGCKGIMINAHEKRPLDKPEFMAVYERMVKYDLPICIHPTGGGTGDYPGENESLYQIWTVWGWPYQTTLAMTRLVFSGVFDRLPNIKFVTHHSGGMVPFDEYRIYGFYDRSIERKEPFVAGLKKHPADYYRMFYNDVASSCTTPGLMCAYHFFDADHLIFGTDMPWGPPAGYGNHLYRDTIKWVEGMDIPADEKEKIFVGNARKLFHLA